MRTSWRPRPAAQRRPGAAANEIEEEDDADDRRLGHRHRQAEARHESIEKHLGQDEAGQADGEEAGDLGHGGEAPAARRRRNGPTDMYATIEPRGNSSRTRRGSAPSATRARRAVRNRSAKRRRLPPRSRRLADQGRCTGGTRRVDPAASTEGQAATRFGTKRSLFSASCTPDAPASPYSASSLTCHVS